MNCASSPIIISRGCINTGLKSDALKVSPIPNITTPNIGVMADVDAHRNDLGTNSEIAETATTMSAMLLAIKAANLYIYFIAVGFLQKEKRT